MVLRDPEEEILDRTESTFSPESGLSSSLTSNTVGQASIVGESTILFDCSSGAGSRTEGGQDVPGRYDSLPFVSVNVRRVRADSLNGEVCRTLRELTGATEC